MVAPAALAGSPGVSHSALRQSSVKQFRCRVPGRSAFGVRRHYVAPIAALDIDWSDPDTLIGAAGAVLGLGLGLAVPIFYISRDEADEKRLEELRQLNRETFKTTGEYLSEEEIAAFRTPRWTDRREFVDDD